MGCLFFTLSGLSGELQRSPICEWKDSGSGHVMSYNQIVFTVHLHTKKDKKVGLSTNIPKLI